MLQYAPGLNHIHVTALATQLASLIPHCPQHINSRTDTNGASSSSSSSGSGDSSNGSHQTHHTLHMLVQRVLSLLYDNADTLDARGLANSVWAVARIVRGLRALHSCPDDGPMDSSAHQGSGAMGKAAFDRSDLHELTKQQELAACVAFALLRRASSSNWGLGFSPQVRVKHATKCRHLHVCACECTCALMGQMCACVVMRRGTFVCINSGACLKPLISACDFTNTDTVQTSQKAAKVMLFCRHSFLVR